MALDSVEEMDMLYKDLYKNVRVSKHQRILGNEEEGEEEGEEEEYVEEEPEIDYDPDLIIESLIRFMGDQERRKKELGIIVMQINNP